MPYELIQLLRSDLQRIEQNSNENVQLLSMKEQQTILGKELTRFYIANTTKYSSVDWKAIFTTISELLSWFTEHFFDRNKQAKNIRFSNVLFFFRLGRQVFITGRELWNIIQRYK